MNTKHTPGPWRTAKAATGNIEVFGPDGLAIARANRLYKAAPVEANAQLIAAAPELLDALDALHVAADMAEHAGRPLSANAPEMLQARAAIAKAEGRT